MLEWMPGSSCPSQCVDHLCIQHSTHDTLQHCVKKVAFVHDIVDMDVMRFFVPYSAEFRGAKFFAFFEDQPPTSKLSHENFLIIIHIRRDIYGICENCFREISKN